GGEVYVTGLNETVGGFGIFRWDGDRWEPCPGGGVRIAVDESGSPWVVNQSGTLYRWSDDRWQEVLGSARDVGAGEAGVWVIGAGPAGGGHPIYKWEHDACQPKTGGGMRIAVGRDVWVTNDQNEI